MARRSNQMISTSRIKDLAHKYDGFILDQYGVLHNGTSSCPGSIDCLERLYNSGKKLMLLSNSSKRAEFTLSRLNQYGISPEWFIGAVTSGEEVCKSLNAKPIGKSCVWLTWKDADLSYLNDCHVQAAPSVDQADFILAHGSQDIVFESKRLSTTFHKTNDWTVIDPILQQALKKQLPMVCANPDLISIKPDGSIAHMPGKIAQRYAELGGEVTYYGKPHARHFQTCIDLMGIDPSKIIHVGDSLHHDIQGANNAGVDSVFVANGVHAHELGLDPIDGRNAAIDQDQLIKLVDSTGCAPTYTVSAFSW